MHLPLDFHHLAFYVLDEDTVGCVRGPLLGTQGRAFESRPTAKSPPSAWHHPSSLHFLGGGSLTPASWAPSAGMTTSSARSP